MFKRDRGEGEGGGGGGEGRGEKERDQKRLIEKSIKKIRRSTRSQFSRV